MSSQIAPPTDSETRAVFVIDSQGGGQGGLVAAIDLLQTADHLSIEHMAAKDESSGEALMQFAEVAARGIGLREIRLKPNSVPSPLATKLGYRDGIKRLRRGAARYLEEVGVPLWRDGWAPLSQTIYFRGVWICVALMVGFGSISFAVFSAGTVTWLRFLVPAVLCGMGILFALSQILLIVKAAHRVNRGVALPATGLAAAAAVLAIGTLVQDRAVPALGELWAIRTGDAELSKLEISANRDGTILYVEGSYGIRAADDVRRALELHRGVREVVLAGPGGRAGPAFEMFDMFGKRRLATRVESECYSACTIAFLGGVERSISPHGKLGFHRASFPGMSDNDMHESNRGDRRFLQYGAKLTAEFVNRIMQTPPESIWVPTAQELLAGRVIDLVRP